MKVQIVIEGSAVWAGDDWVSARTFLVDLYGSNNSIPVNSSLSVVFKAQQIGGCSLSKRC